MYEPNFYQRVKSMGYKAVLLAVASFGIGFLANKYFSERHDAEISTASEPDQETKESLDKTVLKIEKRDGTIEEVVTGRENIIMCTEEDIAVTNRLFGISDHQPPK